VTAIVNTGDDFSHQGLAVSPDIDTLLYTLSGRANAAQGWGRQGETWSFMEALRSLGGEDWFLLGDGDLALHVLRTQRLRLGAPLSKIVAQFAMAWGIQARILPMTDDPVVTRLETDEGVLDFQDYFVRRRCLPRVRQIHFAGASAARPAPGVIEAILDPQARAILIAPSNPYLSVDPILAVPGVSEALAKAAAPVIAVSPLIAGKAVKGPTAKLMMELGIKANTASIARHYQGRLDGVVADLGDGPLELDIAHALTDTLMQTLEDRVRVARAALDLADRVRR
jgi:LPPG:FO 2-phospho-L-lactate transferase